MIAFLVHPSAGVIWQANNLLFAWASGQHFLAHYADGHIEAIGMDGSLLARVDAKPGMQIAAARVVERVLWVAEFSEGEAVPELREAATIPSSLESFG